MKGERRGVRIAPGYGIMNESTELLIERSAEAMESADRGESRLRGDFAGFRRSAERMTDAFIDALFPRHAAQSVDRAEALRLAAGLLEGCLKSVVGPEGDAQGPLHALISELPKIKRQLSTDLEAAYRGDPAAKSWDEIILCYPAFTAIATYRLAHVLYREEVPLLPRVMTEYAHRLTGIDIHPGATIGDSFFIDHGTGVVIGETTTIGRGVKLYQHVTLGAKSFDVGEDGTLVKGIKRHPDIGDRVVIYSGATILGGRTRIGSDCVIGGGVWLTHSVEPGKMVLARAAVSDDTLTRDLMVEAVLDSAML